MYVCLHSWHIFYNIFFLLPGAFVVCFSPADERSRKNWNLCYLLFVGCCLLVVVCWLLVVFVVVVHRFSFFGNLFLLFCAIKVAHEFKERKLSSAEPILVNVPRGNVVSKHCLLVWFWKTCHQLI